MQPARFFYIYVYIYIIYVYIYLTDRIVLNVSTRFYFSVYTTISLEPRASCCLCHGQLSSTMPSNAMHPSRSPSTPTMPGLKTDHSLCLNGVNPCCVSPPPTTTLCVFYGEPYVCTTWYGASLCSSVYTSTCGFAEHAVLRFVMGHFILYNIIY